MGKHKWLIGFVALVGIGSIVQKGSEQWCADMGNGCLGLFSIFCVVVIVSGISSLVAHWRKMKSNIDNLNYDK